MEQGIFSLYIGVDFVKIGATSTENVFLPHTPLTYVKDSVAINLPLF